MLIEFLVAWKDGTWTVVAEEVPPDLALADSDLEIEDNIVDWVHSPSGLMGEEKYRKAVMFSVHH